MTDAELQAQYQAAVAKRGSSPQAGCPSPEELRALVERTGDEESRLETLDHVMSCRACHRELALLRAIYAAQPRQTALMPRQWLAAASLLLLLGGGALVTRAFMGRSSDELTRGGGFGAASDQTIAVIAPLSGSPANGLRTLVWHSVPGAVRYSVEVLDQNDRVLFVRQTPDTVVAVPALPTPPAAWWVRATLSDGSERRSAIVRLEPRG